MCLWPDLSLTGSCRNCDLIAKVRADEREQVQRELWPMIAAGEAEALADLHVRVAALPHADDCDFGRFTPDDDADCTCLRADVLALLDGSSDD